MTEPSDDRHARDLGTIRTAVVTLAALAVGAAGVYGLDQLKDSNERQSQEQEFVIGGCSSVDTDSDVYRENC